MIFWRRPSTCRSSFHVPSVLFQHNVEAMIWQRHYEVQTNPIKKAYLYGQWRKMRAFETAACHRFDHVVAVSREDSELMQREYGLRQLTMCLRASILHFFRPRRKCESGRPHNLVFTGSMDWLPNEDAIRYFTEQIMPLIKQRLPDRHADGGGAQSLSGAGRLKQARPFDYCYRTR